MSRQPPFEPVPPHEFIMRPVHSSMIESIGYDSARFVMQIRFKPTPPATVGPLYQYSEVLPGLWHDLMQAESVGKEFSRQVKNNPSYPAQRVVEDSTTPEETARA